MNAADQKKQDDYFKSNVNNLITQANARSSPRFSAFLDERERALAEEVLRHNRCEGVFFGGMEECERVLLGVFPAEIEPNHASFPIAALRVSHSGRVELSHRDYLGALMSLQLERDAIGDIVPTDSGAVLFLSRDVSEFVRMNLTRIGRTSVEVKVAELESLERKQEFSQLTGTVSSLRLDCVTALLMGKSRTIAVEQIEAGLVKVNGLEAANVSKVLSLGDRIAIRGHGKFILGQEGQELKKTKKDRIFLTVQKYL